MRLTFLLIALSFPFIAECTPALVGHATAAGANGGTTVVVTTTGATLFVVNPGYSTGTSLTVSDHCANTWSSVAASVLAGNMSDRIYYVVSPTLCASETFTVACTSCDVSFEVQTWSGAGALKQSATAQNSGGTSTTTTGPITTVVGDLLISGIGFYQASLTASSPFSAGDAVNGVGGVNYGSQIASGIATTTSTSATWTNGGGTATAATIASFAAVSPPSGGSQFFVF